MKKLLLLSSFILIACGNIFAQLTVTISSKTDASVCNAPCNGSATASASGGTPPYFYLWSTGATTQSATGLCPGTYSVGVSDAAFNTASTTVNILCVQSIFDYEMNRHITISPNPASDVISVSVSLPNAGPVEKVSVYNAEGKKMIEESFTSSRKFSGTLSTASLPEGIYFLELKDEENTYRTKFIRH